MSSYNGPLAVDLANQGIPLPHNTAAEAALLGTILCNNAALDKCTGLAAEYFFEPANGALFAAMKRRIEAGRPVDGVIMYAAIGHLVEDAARWIAQLSGQMVSPWMAPEYATVIRDCALRRVALEVAHGVIERAQRTEPDHGDGMDTLTRAVGLLETAVATHGIEQPTTMAEAVAAASDQSDRAFRGDESALGLRVGIPAMDEALCGLHPGSLDMIAALSGEGKSAMALQIARHNAAQGVPVAYFSMEMKAEDIGFVNLASETGLSVDQLRLGRYPIERAADIVKAGRYLAKLPIHFIYEGMSPSGAISMTRAMIRSKGIRLAIFDHREWFLHDPGHEKDLEMAWIRHLCRSLKTAAKSLGIPLILLVQLSRDIERREDKRPRKSDLWGGGEREADNIAMLYRPEMHTGEAPKRGHNESDEAFHDKTSRWYRDIERLRGVAEVYLVKRRFGPPGMISLMFDGPSLTFR